MDTNANDDDDNVNDVPNFRAVFVACIMFEMVFVFATVAGYMYLGALWNQNDHPQPLLSLKRYWKYQLLYYLLGTAVSYVGYNTLSFALDASGPGMETHHKHEVDTFRSWGPSVIWINVFLTASYTIGLVWNWYSLRKRRNHDAHAESDPLLVPVP